MPQIIDGKALAETIKKEIGEGVKQLVAAGHPAPTLAAILVGEDPASQIYVRNKIKTCEELGIKSESHYLPATTREDDLLELIHGLNKKPEVDGILLQLPLPKQINKQKVLDAISPAKDVDGLHPTNVGLLVQGRAELIACTPLGVIQALKRYNVKLEGTRTTIVGRSDLVGKPLALLLMHEHSTITICHSKTRNLPAVAAEADLLIAAMGKAAFITPDFVKPGAVLVDVGINVLKNEADVAAIFGPESKKMQDFKAGKNVMVGDVHPAAHEKSSLYTPVPGGVGPLTIALLMRNTLRAGELRR